ncbi:MAG: hypothetical protein AAF329_21995, partial [Cyanobacteria bacterium P01_A01_bin.17]
MTVSLASEDALGVPALKSEAWLRECLERSPVKIVYLEREMGTKAIESWATVCKDSGKRVYLELSSANDVKRNQQQ